MGSWEVGRIGKAHPGLQKLGKEAYLLFGYHMSVMMDGYFPWLY